jgi:hypothetical protein
VTREQYKRQKVVRLFRHRVLGPGRSGRQGATEAHRDGTWTRYMKSMGTTKNRTGLTATALSEVMGQRRGMGMGKEFDPVSDRCHHDLGVTAALTKDRCRQSSQTSDS